MDSNPSACAPRAYLSLGSNVGDSAAILDRAVALIADVFPDAAVRRSRTVASEPWGFESENMFLNLCVELTFAGAIDPESLLDSLQAIERSISDMPHRNADGTYRDRAIDIDIVAVTDASGRSVSVSTPRLTLPHPRSILRPFVTVPLADFIADPIAFLSENR